MGIFTQDENIQPKPTKTTTQLVHEVRAAMSTELGFTLNADQAVERLCRIYLDETVKPQSYAVAQYTKVKAAK